MRISTDITATDDEREKQKRYAAVFLGKYAPNFQAEYTRDRAQVFTSNNPAPLSVIAKYIGRYGVEKWLEVQLQDLAKASGCRDKPTNTQLDNTARTMYEECYYLKPTEFMLFFQLYKAGHYGHFFGTFDTLAVTAALTLKFLPYRQSKIAQYCREREQVERERAWAEHQGHCMTYEEWQELGWLFNMGYEPWRIKIEMEEQRRCEHNVV